MINQIKSIYKVCIILIIIFYFQNNYKLFNRPIWYNPKKIISFNGNGRDTSNQIFDIYSFCHITQGMVINILLHGLNIPFNYRILITTIIVLLWELYENSQKTINKFKKQYNQYNGDSIVNVIGDLMSCLLGVYLINKYPNYSYIYLIVSEIILSKYKANFIYLTLTGFC